MRLLPACLALLVWLTASHRAMAHEFWISPESYRVDVGAPLVARLRMGAEFKGFAQTYFPDRFARFEVKMGEILIPVEGRLGDNPALNQVIEGQGLAVVIHQTQPTTLRYKTRDLFESFVAHKDLGDVLARHAARGLPDLAFEETYTRFAKSLMAIGPGTGADSYTGMPLELVALENPYDAPAPDEMSVRLFQQGAPRPDTQVEVFARAPDGTVVIELYRTDATGTARFPLLPGTEYMVDAVIMEDTGNDDPEAGPVWHSAWANLTFQTP